MLVIVKKPTGGFLVARDTRVLLNDEPEDSSLESNDLLCPSYDDPDTIFGSQGDMPQCNIVKYLPNVLPAKDKPLTMSYVVNTMVPYIYDSLAGQHLVKKDDSIFFASKFVYVRREAGFLIDLDGSVEEIGEEEATGIGAPYADGILRTNGHKDPLVRIMECFDFVADHSYHVSRNVIVADSMDTERWVLYDAEDVKAIINGTFKSSIVDETE